MNTFVMLIVKACLIVDPTTCIEPQFLMRDGVTEEQCQHQAPMMLPQILAQHPDFTINAFACVAMHKDRGA